MPCFIVFLFVVLSTAMLLQGCGAGSSPTPAKNSCPVLPEIKAFLIDLDGTMYLPDGLVPGAKSFVQWMNATGKPFVFLSNSGSKGPQGVQAKFMTPPFVLQSEPIGLNHVYTGASAVAMWLTDNAPSGSRIFIIQGMTKYGPTTDSFVRVMQRLVPSSLLASWSWRTDMSDKEIKSWAADSRAGHPTFVVLSDDGRIQDEADPVTNKSGYSDWSYDLLSHAQQLLQNGASLISQAPDSVPTPDRRDGLVLDTPGPGPFVQLLKSAIFPRALNRTFCTGKGGNLGSKYMYQKGLELLRAQGYDGGLENIAMVGDVFNTDIKGGQDFGVNTFLVLSGCGTVEQQQFFPGLKPTCVFDNVGAIPPTKVAASETTERSSLVV